jgi:superfamily II DNA helicase RecQ
MLSGVLEGEYQLIFFTPELLIGKRKWRELLREALYASRLRAFIIDEAHTKMVST